jgi:PKD repeat protein
VTRTGLDVVFDGSSSYDPDQGTIPQWTWDFGDGSPPSITGTSTVEHSYEVAGTYQVTLTVTDSQGSTSSPSTTPVTVPEHEPTLLVNWPLGGASFGVGQRVALSATAQDPEDGALRASSIRWEFRVRHGNHFHPYATRSGGQVSVPYPTPESLTAASQTHLLVLARVTDSAGLAATARHIISPKTVAVTFRTSPAHGRIVVDGVRHRAPFAAKSWANYAFPVHAPNQPFGGSPYVFRRWSDGGMRTHTIITPRSPATYTATFRPAR